MIRWKWSSSSEGKHILRHQCSVTDLDAVVVVNVVDVVVVAVAVADVNKVFLFIYRHSVELPQ